MHQFTRWTDKSAFTRRHDNHHTTTVYLLQPPHSHSSSSDHSWITARETNPDYTFTFRHPLTSKPHSFTTPLNFDFFKLYLSDLAVSYRIGDSYPVDKLLKLNDGSLLALYGGGQLQTCPRYAPEEDDVAGISPWVKLSPNRCFDDITVFRDNIYALDRQGWIVLIHSYKTVRNLKIGRRIMTRVTPGAGGFGWRKRFAIDGGKLYMVVRDGERSLRVYLMEHRGKTRGKGFYWQLMSGFDSKKVLFMGRDHYFFRKATRKFPGREYKNCIVFSEAAFPQYGKGCWEYTQSDRQLSEDDIAVYRFEYDDRIFAREGEHSVFPKINWSPPAWIFNASSIPAAEFQEHVISESSSQSEREPDEDDGLDSDSGDKNDREVQSRLEDSKNKDDDEQEEMETNFGSLDQDQDGVVSPSDSQNKEDGNMQCDSNSQEKEDVETHVNANTEGGASLQEDVCHVFPSLSRPESGTTVTQTHSLSPTEEGNGTEEGNDFHISTYRRPFTRITDESAFTCRHHRLHYTQLHVLHPPCSLSSDHRPWITARETTTNNTVIFRHPLTSQPYSLNLPENINIFKLHPSTISISYHLGKSYPVDNLLVFPALSNFVKHYDSNYCVLLALYGGGRIQGCPRYEPEERWPGSDYSPWVKLSPFSALDDITVFQDKIYGVTGHCWVVLIYYYKTTRKFRVGGNIMSGPLSFGIGWFRWRKRFVVCGENLYLVVRTAEKSFRVYMLKKQGMSPGSGFYWDRVDEFKGNKVLFMARDYYFFRKASRKFPGKEYKNCIVFSEAAFPQYGNGCWEFTKSGDRQFSEDDIAVFRLDDQTFAREGENSVFPKIDWSPPDWILNVSSFPADEFQEHTLSESSSNSEREPDEDDRLDCDNGDKNDGEVQSDLRDTKSKDEEEQEEMETDFGSLGQDQDGVVSHSDSQNKEDGNMQCDLNSREKDDVEVHVNADTEAGASLQDDVPESGPTITPTPSLSATEKEIPRTPLSPNGGNNGTEEGTSSKNIIDLVHRASTSSTRVRQRSDSATGVFEGFDIRPDLVPTLEKIWQKHGNILENSAVRSDDIIARGLESLATIVRILGDNSALSLNDRQADYLVSTLSDLRYIRFKVDWLIPFVEKAEKLHKSKPLVESLNNLSQLSSQAKECRAMLLDELTKLDEEENQRKEEMAKVSKMIPFCGQVKFDELLGTGLI